MEIRVSILGIRVWILGFGFLLLVMRRSREMRREATISGGDAGFRFQERDAGLDFGFLFLVMRRS